MLGKYTIGFCLDLDCGFDLLVLIDGLEKGFNNVLLGLLVLVGCA